MYKLILQELSKYKISIFLMFALTVAGAVVTSLVPNMVGEIIDVALADENIRHLGQLAGFLIVFLMVSNLCVAVRQYLSATVTAKFGISLTEKVFGNILHTQYRFFTENQSGDILQRVTKDLKALQDIQLDTLLGFGYDAVLAVFFHDCGPEYLLAAWGNGTYYIWPVSSAYTVYGEAVEKIFQYLTKSKCKIKRNGY